LYKLIFLNMAGLGGETGDFSIQFYKRNTLSIIEVY